MNKKDIKISGNNKQPKDNMRFSKEEKAIWLSKWRKSKKKAWTFARENNLSPQTFLKWTKVETKSKPDFVQVPSTIIQPLQAVQELVIEKDEMKIHIPVSIEYNALCVIFTALRGSV
jgi:hypothetical protein